MALIEVNHSVLRSVAAAIDTYCTAQDKEMKAADSAIKSMLATDWQGADAQEFGKKWAGVNVNGSMAMKFRDSLKKYSEALNSCADIYKNAQADSYNEANKLPRVLYW